jgi:hypothetical protein
VSELRRWSEEGATADEVSLLEALRRERAPSHLRARTLRTLGVAAAVTTATTTTTAATTAAVTKGGLTALTKVLAVSMLGGGIVAGGLVIRGLPQTVLPSSRTVVAPRAVEPAVIESPSPVLPAVLASGLVAPIHVGVPARSARPASTDDGLSREVLALELAHQALAGHNPEAALHLLDRYRAQFPGGALASEQTVLRVQALLAKGDRTGARALAAAYAVAHPDSPYARRLGDLVHTEP